MNRKTKILSILLSACCIVPIAGAVVTPKPVKAVTGTATLKQTEKGVLIHAIFQNVPPGWHAMHIHEVGKCEPPDFKTAGGHFNPTHKMHGYMNPSGAHAGDLPNVYADASGKVDVEVLAPDVSLEPGANSLLDGDGSALVLHEKADDYSTNPAGNAGKRIGCAVIH